MIPRHSVLSVLLVAAITSACGASEGPVTPTRPAVATPAGTPPATPQGQTTFSRVFDISGAVRDATGQAIVHALVEVQSESETWRRQVLADDNGMLTFPRLTVRVSSQTGARLIVKAARPGYRETSVTTNVRADAADAVAVSVTMQSLLTLLDASASVTAVVSSSDSKLWLGEPYDSDYCTACRFFTLPAQPGFDVRVQLRANGRIPLELWMLDDWIPTGSTLVPGSDTLRQVVVPAGRRVQIVVGTSYPTPAPAVPESFTLTTALVPSSAGQ